MWVLDGKKPIYIQIYEQFKQMILDQKYVENQKLPSKRTLANQLRISPMTVDVAYQQLMAEGYIYSKPKSGFYVEKQIDKIKPIEHKTPLYMGVISEIKHYQFDFKTNVVDTSLFPYSTWSKLTKTVLLDYASNLFKESDPQGLFELRVEIAKHLEINRGITIDINQIVIGSGSTSLITMLIELLGRNLHYAIENPGYERMYQLFKGQGVNLSFIQLDQQGVKMNDLKRVNPNIMHITPSHQFPSGIVMPIGRRIELLNWANETQNRFIIEDDYDSEFRYSGKPIPALFGLNPNTIIYMNTFTKTLAPSFRVNYMVLPKSLLNRYHVLKRYHSCTVPLLEQYVLYLLMKQGSFSRHINKTKQLYKQKVDIILTELAKTDIIKPLHFEAGLHGILEINGIKDKVSYLKALEEASIHIKPITQFYFDNHHEKKLKLVLGYAGININQLQHAMIELIRITKKHCQF